MEDMTGLIVFGACYGDVMGRTGKAQVRGVLS